MISEKDLITLVTNSNQSHKEIILQQFDDAEEIIIAVGFFKDSGFNNLKQKMIDFVNKPSTKSKFFVGTGFGETTPSSLRSLYKLIKDNPKHDLTLCTPDGGIFHPKIYLFRKGNRVVIITGSSNLTESGWCINDEVSLKVETTVESKYYIQITKYFENLFKTYYTEDIESLIDKYSKALKEYKAKYSLGGKFKFVNQESDISEIDIHRLKQYYKFYKQSDAFIVPEEREEQYLEAYQNLNKLARQRELSKQGFHDLFGPLVGHSKYRKLWHSGSIHRKTHKTLEYYPVFQQLVRLIKKNIDEPIDIGFDNIMEFLNSKRKNKEISGIGLNIVAEILMTFDSNKYANINANPIATLSLLGKEFKRIDSFKGVDYQEYVELLSLVKEQLKMDSFLEVDSFFNYVYWNLIEE